MAFGFEEIEVCLPDFRGRERFHRQKEPTEYHINHATLPIPPSLFHFLQCRIRCLQCRTGIASIELELCFAAELFYFLEIGIALIVRR